MTLKRYISPYKYLSQPTILCSFSEVGMEESWDFRSESTSLYILYAMLGEHKEFRTGVSTPRSQ